MYNIGGTSTLFYHNGWPGDPPPRWVHTPNVVILSAAVAQHTCAGESAKSNRADDRARKLNWSQCIAAGCRIVLSRMSLHYYKSHKTSYWTVLFFTWFALGCLRFFVRSEHIFSKNFFLGKAKLKSARKWYRLFSGE